MTEQPNVDESRQQHPETYAPAERHPSSMQPGEKRDLLPSEPGRPEQTLFRLADTSSEEAGNVSDLFSIHTDQEGRLLLETSSGTPDDAFVAPKGVDIIVGADGIWMQPGDKSQPPQLMDIGSLPLAARRLLMQARYGMQQNPGSMRRISFGVHEAGDGQPFLSVRNMGNVPLDLETHTMANQETAAISDGERRNHEVAPPLDDISVEASADHETKGEDTAMSRLDAETSLVEVPPQGDTTSQGLEKAGYEEQPPSEPYSELPPEILEQYIREMEEDREERLRSFRAFEEEIEEFNLTNKHIQEAIGIIKTKIEENRLMDRPRELVGDIDSLRRAIERQYSALDQLVADFRRRVTKMLDDQRMNRGRNEAERRSRNTLLNHYAVGGKGANELRGKLNEIDDIIEYEMMGPLRRLDMPLDEAEFAREMENPTKKQDFTEDLSSYMTSLARAIDRRDKTRGKFMEFYGEMKQELEKI